MPFPYIRLRGGEPVKEKEGIKRRDFIRLSTTTLAVGIAAPLSISGEQGETASTLEEAVRKVGRIPRRRLGYSGREVSIVIGAGDLAQVPTELAIQCGINYWHKANRWSQNGVPASILKNRDEHIIQVNVDRIAGNHEIGRIDEESHYQFVKQSLAETGLRYYDDMQFHYGYHNREEIKTENGFVRAFERLKKEGLVKHLCIAQHGYFGNPRVPKGEAAAEILTALVEDGIYEHAQIIYSYGADPDMNAFLSLARKKGFGTIAMKTARGLGRMLEDQNFMDSLPPDTSPHNALARWLTTETLLDAVVIRVRNISEFADTYSGAGRPVRTVDARALTLMNEYSDRTACRLCTVCQAHCPQGVPITEILRFERYALDDRAWDKARTLYSALGCQADSCISCGTCLPHCRQGLDIPAKLARTHTLLKPV